MPDAPHPQNPTEHRKTRGCIQCGYDLTGISPNNSCPECGASQSSPDNNDQTLRQQNTVLIAVTMVIALVLLALLRAVPLSKFGLPSSRLIALSILGGLALSYLIIYAALATTSYRTSRNLRPYASALRALGLWILLLAITGWLIKVFGLIAIIINI